MFMKLHFLPNRIDYDGCQLRSRWIEEQTGTSGDAIVAFIGTADVGAEHMVDLEDLAAEAWIHSDLMLHFIIEHRNIPLAQAITQQCLFVATMAEELRIARPAAKIIRQGNDLFEGDAKLSVSIATTSPTSSLIHVGINILSTNTPVITKGLQDYDINPNTFGTRLMERYVAEMAGITHAATKVRGVR